MELARHPVLVEGRCALVGMVHLLPLPGSARWGRGGRAEIQAMLDRAARDAEALLVGGCDALLVENMHDLPYLRGHVPPETVAAMTLGVAHVAALGAPVGVQVLAGANREALGVAIAAGASFIRAEAFAYAHVADEGWMDATAGELLRARHALEPVGAAIQTAIWADIKKKHSAHAVTADISLGEFASGSAFCGADAVIVTGQATGQPARLEDVIEAKVAKLPVVVGSGIDASNAATFAEHAAALIVGTSLKVDGDWRNPVDRVRVDRLARALGRVA